MNTTRVGWRTRMKTAAGYHAYAVAALPMGLIGLFAAPLGAARTVGRLHRAAASRLLGTAVGTEVPRAGRLFAHWLTSLPANLLAFALTAPFWALFLTRGVFYPIFGADNLEDSWGGPTLAGAWLAHFIQGPPALIVITVILWPISHVQTRQAHRRLA